MPFSSPDQIPPEIRRRTAEILRLEGELDSKRTFRPIGEFFAREVERLIAVNTTLATPSSDSELLFEIESWLNRLRSHYTWLLNRAGRASAADMLNALMHPLAGEILNLPSIEEVRGF